MKKGDHLYLVDGSAYIFRAYHALPPLTRKSDGLPIGAVSGFCNMLWKLLDEARDTARGVVPTHFAVIFDYSSTTFRNELYPEYKANRSEPPEDLRPQFALIRQATRAFDVPCIETEGFEADDIIATYAKLATEAGADTTIVSSDKDLMQLINPQVVMYDTMKDIVVDEEGVFAKFGVDPSKMIDLQALAGDSTDNIPGVPGIGPKTAAQLLDEYGTLEELLERAGEIKQNKRRENMIEHADLARISKQLVTLRDDVPLDMQLDELALDTVNGPRLIAFLKGIGLNSLTRRVAVDTDTDAANVEAEEVGVEGYEMRGPDMDAPQSIDGDHTQPQDDNGDGPPYRPSKLVEELTAKVAAEKIEHSAYETVRDAEALKRWIAEAHDLGHVAVDTETTSLDAMACDLVGVSLATGPGRACYIPLAHLKDGSSDDGDMFSEGLDPDQMDLKEALALLKPMLEAPSVLKIAQNLKYDWLVLSRYGIEVGPFDDTMLLSYVLDAGRGKHGMDALSLAHLDHTPIPFKEVAGSGKSMVTFDKVSIEKASAYAAEDADVTLRLWTLLKARLVAEKMVTVYERLERPLVPVLCRMEARGVEIDRQILSRLSGELAQKAAGIEADIHEMAGEPINIASPKQLGELLFGKMELPGGKKTKTGQWATGAQALEDLAAEGHELPRRIVDWRQLTKLKSTYTDALPTFINKTTGRVHTSYAMASTTTGRFSSSEPNLQNIPVRTEAGRKIRTAFIAADGHKLVSADYSQIELRVLAHMADISQLKQAFADGIDIHAMTASEMFNVPVEGMDPSIRRQAKAINFGIIYGISAFGLANNLGIDRGEASDYIKMYFERFPGIRDYMDETKKFAREHGYVETIFGRRAHYPEIKSSNPQMRAFNERAAINAPIQGSAADIIRRAMARMEGALAAEKLSAQMLLQVHDELIFEVPDDEVDATIETVVKVMEDAPMPALSLSVPLQVDARAAENWDEAH
ncbi:DNA polymerase I [Ahrensia sp. R2A130]|uniref:DNA polymerase I n=1 Tax=Ahrensia sp. R2A130 TaxID=744979 RepID=UPI0001E0ACD5|nr:DNA polymerase I [Ahrensia sp. R2A130]EFL88454.1 DNA polymerase I [Ahrensia sp. R2A130]